MNPINEVLVTSESTAQLWNFCVWDPETGTGLVSFKNEKSAPDTLCTLGRSYFASASHSTNSSLIMLWTMGRQEQSCKKMVAPGKVRVLTSTPDGVYVFAAIEERLYVWQTSSGRLLAVVGKHYQPITCLGVSDDGCHVISGGQDHQVVVWALHVLLSRASAHEQPKPRYTWSHHSLAVTGLHVTSGPHPRVASCSLDHTVKLYTLASGQLLCDVTCDVGLTSVTLDHAEWRVFAGGSDGSISVADVLDPEVKVSGKVTAQRAMQGHTKAVTGLKTSLDGCTLYSASMDCDVRVWDVTSGQCVRSIAHKGPVTNMLLLMPPDRLLAVDAPPPDLPVTSFSRALYKPSAGDPGLETVRLPPPSAQSQSESDRLHDDLLREARLALRYDSRHKAAPAAEPVTPQAGHVDKATKDKIRELYVVNEQLYRFAVDHILKDYNNEDEEEISS